MLVCGLGVEILACDVGVRVACDEEEVALVQILLVGVQRGLDGGLPAGPISCPGYAAIEAALNPDQEMGPAGRPLMA